MELKRRHIFHGDAVAIGGRIVRPDHVVIDPKCGSTLPVTGGRTASKLKGASYGKYVRFASASTSAEGAFDNRKRAVAMTLGKVREEELSATTVVRAELLGLSVGIQPKLTVKRLRGSLTGKSPENADGETSVGVGADTTIDGVAIDGHRLVIELNKKLFVEFDTFSKLKKATADPVFVKGHANHFIASATIAEKPTSGLIEVRGTCYGSIVRSIRWSGKPYPGAAIDGHLVTVPDFGRIYFGEILISRDMRRVTLMRLDLGSPFGGSMAVCDYQDNGGWYP